MRSLTIDGRIFAEAEIQSVTLHPVVGAYELRFGLNIVVMPESGGRRYRIVFDSMRFRVKAGEGEYNALGFAHAESRVEIDTEHFPRLTPVLSLPLQSVQIAAIEKLRNAGDLSFELLINGTGSVRSDEEHVESWFQETLRIDVPRSKWIDTLKAAGARNTLLIEVLLPLSGRSDTEGKISEYMWRAESQFRNGDYRGCVATCRDITQELGYRKSRKRNWSMPSLKPLNNRDEREKMSKYERELAALAALRHYAHLAHHAQSEGGEDRYTRDDAWHVFSLTASFVARWMPQ